MLNSLMPEERWPRWKFERVSPGFWASSKQQRDALDWFYQSRNMRSMSDWYSIRSSDLKAEGIAAILNHYVQSIPFTLQSIYIEYALFPLSPPDFNRSLTCPEFASSLSHAWQPGRFLHHKPVPSMLSASSNESWKEWIRKSARERLDHIEGKSESTLTSALNRWYSISPSEISSVDPSFLADASLLSWLQCGHPQHLWLPWCFSHFPVPRNYWNDPTARLHFTNWLASQLGVIEPVDWYRLGTQAAFQRAGGWGLLLRYNGSIACLLRDILPETSWEEWRFSQTPKQWWATVSRCDPAFQSFLRHLSAELEIASPEDWYRVSHKDVEKAGGAYALRVYGSLSALLHRAFPDHTWNDSLFSSLSKQAGQRGLFRKVRELLGDDFGT